MTANATTPNPEQIKQLLRSVFPRRSIQQCELLSGGLINTNIKVVFESSNEPVVLRLYSNGPDVCKREVAIHNLICKAVPVPCILHAEPSGLHDSPPFAIIEFVGGITFQMLKRSGNLRAIKQASYSAGQTLATIGQFKFQRQGRLVGNESGGLVVGSTFADGPDAIAKLTDEFLASPECQRRAGAELVSQLHEFFWRWSAHLPNLDNEHSLVHSDFGNRNILVREEKGSWVVAAVLDWEFGFSGSPLLDVGHFLRYERASEPMREPFFSQAFVEHGGHLPDNWREIVRVIDLTGLVESLTHKDLPPDVEEELLEMIKATLEHRDCKLNTDLTLQQDRFR